MLFLYIFLAIMISLLIMYLRPDKGQLNEGFISSTIGWTLIIYGLILAFSINIFYTRYIEIRTIFADEVNNLLLTYRYFKVLPDNEFVLHSIHSYANSVLNDLLPSLQNGEYSEKTNFYYTQMTNTIINYVNDHPTIVFDNNILIRLTTNERIKQIAIEIKNQYYITIIWLLFLFVLIPMFFISTPNRSLQFLMDSCILIILLTLIYVITILNNPFRESPIQIELTMYQDLLNN